MRRQLKLTASLAELGALAQRSVEIITAHQDVGGAYPASPTFRVYRYSWLRDGSFIADAMSRAGAVASAEATRARRTLHAGRVRRAGERMLVKVPFRVWTGVGPGPRNPPGLRIPTKANSDAGSSTSTRGRPGFPAAGGRVPGRLH